MNLINGNSKCRDVSYKKVDDLFEMLSHEQNELNGFINS